MLLARATSRQKEFSLRLALGAPRSRLFANFLPNRYLLPWPVALAGLAVAVPLGGSLGYLMPHTSAPTLARAPIDTGVMLFAWRSLASASAGRNRAGMHAARGNVNQTLKEGGRTGSGARSMRLLGLFVSSEMALAVVALIVAGLFVKSFRYASEIRPGFDPEHVAIAQLGLFTANYDAAQADSFCMRLREKLEAPARRKCRQLRGLCSAEHFSGLMGGSASPGLRAFAEREYEDLPYPYGAGIF